jgi:hypothetical protein
VGDAALLARYTNATGELAIVANFAEFPVTLYLPELAGIWSTVIHSAGLSWLGPEQGLAPEITLLAAGELRLSSQSFLVMDRRNTEAM